MNLDKLETYLPDEEERENFTANAEEFHDKIYPPDEWTNADKLRAAIYFACNAEGKSSATRSNVEELYNALDGSRAIRKVIHELDEVKKTEVDGEDHFSFTHDGIKKSRALFRGGTDDN